MNFIKKVLFALIPITTLLIFVSYGIAIIFGENMAITYIEQKQGIEQFTTYPVFNWNNYLTNLTSTNILKPFNTLAISLDTLLSPITSIVNLFKNTNWWKIILNPGITARILINVGILGINLFIFSINLVVAITQSLNMILGALLKLFAINTNANVSLFNVFRKFDNWTLIPYLNAKIW